MQRRSSKPSAGEQLDEVLARIPALRAAGVTSVSVDGLSLDIAAAGGEDVPPISSAASTLEPVDEEGWRARIATEPAAAREGRIHQIARAMAAIGETYVSLDFDNAADAIVTEGGYVERCGYNLRAELRVPVLGGVCTVSAHGPRAEGPVTLEVERVWNRQPTPAPAPKVELPAELAPAATPATATLIVAIVDTTPAPAEKSDEPGARFAQIEIN